MRGVTRAAAAAFAVVVLGMPYAIAAAPRLLCVEPVKPCPATQQAPTGPDVSAYRGLGTWVDAYDFSREYHGRTPPSVVDEMARQGVTTLYIQAAKERAGAKDLLSPDLLGQFLERAHAHDMQVVAWFLPRLVDPDDDWRHIDAILNFRSHGHAFDGFGLDIESREVSDIKTRNDRLVALSQRIRTATRLTTSAIVVPPVVTDVINPKFWPDFPWARLYPLYDVWVPMDYWTNRKQSSEYRDAYRYTTENVRLLREDLGDPEAYVHVAGGIGNEATSTDYDRFVKAAHDSASLGVSCYDWATTARSAYATLRQGPS